jgi:hypothetical protein
MRFRLYREHGALNSQPIFDAFEAGLKLLGHESVKTGDAIPVIWSVLWAGRMAANQKIYDESRSAGTPIIILEVGSLVRGTTWKVSVNHINGLGIFGNDINLDTDRPTKLGIKLNPIQEKRRGDILIATQHSHSLQWAGMPSMKQWTEDTIEKIRQYSKKRIVVRYHPRSPFPLKIRNIFIETPKRIIGSYDDFDIFYGYHCVINYNSGPAVQAAINGIPVICDHSSLAGPLSGTIENINNIVLPDREDWFLRLCHTEWTIGEITKGIPLTRLLGKIS